VPTGQKMTLSVEKTHITHIDDGFVDSSQAPAPDVETDPAPLLRDRPDP
jgi:hypothetical protein